MGKSWAEQKAEAEKELYQLQNKQKVLLNRERREERRARTRRLIEHGAVLEGVFPFIVNMSGEEIKMFLIALSRLPGVKEIAEIPLNEEITE